MSTAFQMFEKCSKPSGFGGVAGQEFFDDFREVAMLQPVYFLGDIVRRIGGLHGAFRLKNDVTIVVLLVYQMDGDTGFRFTGHFNGLMHPHSVHPFSAVLGQKCRVNVHHPAFKSPDQVRWH